MADISLSEMKEIVENRVVELMVKFDEAFDGRTKHRIDIPSSINFSMKGSTAGRSCFNTLTGDGWLDFNTVIMEDNWAEFDQTIIHEVAHYCANTFEGNTYTRGGRYISHGKTWKGMMQFFGVEAERCHNYNTSRVTGVRKQRKFEYKCSCSILEISTVRHNRMTKKGVMYKCRKCNTRIEFIKELKR